MLINIGLDSQAFVETLAHDLRVGRLGVVEAVESVFRDQLKQCANETLAESIIKPVAVELHARYFKSRFATLHELARTGYYTWYPEIRFATAHDLSVREVQIQARNLHLGTINYGDGKEHNHKLFVKELKTQTNHVLRLNKVYIAPELFRKVLMNLNAGERVAYQTIANLTFGPQIHGYRLVSFDNILTGTRRFCECARKAHDLMRESAAAKAPNYAQGAWPHQFLEALKAPVYESGICHLCIATEEGIDASYSRYGNTVVEQFDAYIDQLRRDPGLDERTARAEVQSRLGLSRWARETQLFQMVQKLFPDFIVQREASPIWLGRQRLDVYVPDLRLALEHHGQQHFEPIDIFGGDAALKRTIERDAQKRRLCKENGVTLIEVRFDEPLTVPTLRRRVQRFLT